MTTAKEIYWQNACNHSYILKEGYSDEYKLLGGYVKKIEKEWKQEYIIFWYNKIPTDMFNAFHNLGEAKAINILEKLINYSPLEDDYVRFWHSFMLLEIAGGILNPFKKYKVKRIARRNLVNIINKEITILPKNEILITDQMMTSLKASSPKEYLKNYSTILTK